MTINKGKKVQKLDGIRMGDYVRVKMGTDKSKFNRGTIYRIVELRDGWKVRDCNYQSANHGELRPISRCRIVPEWAITLSPISESCMINVDGKSTILNLDQVEKLDLINIINMRNSLDEMVDKFVAHETGGSVSK